MSRLCLTAIALLLVITPWSTAGAHAAADMNAAPAWEAASAVRLTTAGGALEADGHAMPLLMDFTWSAPEGEDMVKFQSQYLGNSHYRSIALTYDGRWNWKRVDEIYRWGAEHRVYIMLGLNVQQGVSYVRKDPTAAALLADGKPAADSQVSFMHPGYRQVLTQALSELAAHVRTKPYHLGYYPQDEFAYRDYGGYDPASVAAFRQWVVTKRGSLAQVNEAWGAQFARPEDIQPPVKSAPTPAFADWQEFRRFAQMDFTRLVYTTLKTADPDHVVAWSLPFFGGVEAAASWWQFAPVADVLMRHGIAYSTGLLRLKMLSAVSQWSGKPANALCMPPEYDPAFVQMSFMMDGPQSGLSHVCTAGTEDNGPYMGSADPAHGWRRREPMYTISRALNDLVRQMGDSYLRSHPRSPQVGVYVSDRQVLLAGTNINSVNGVLQLLTDLNLDYEIVAEPSWDRLTRYQAVVVGAFSRCASDAMATDLERFVQEGGLLVMTKGAFAADENNLPTGEPGFGLDELIGSTPAGKTPLRDPVALLPNELVTAASPLPCVGPVSLRKAAPGVTVLARVPERGAVVTLRQAGRGRVLYLGMDPGLPYQAGYTEDFAGVLRRPDKEVLDDQAGFHFAPTPGADEAVAGQSHRAYARLIGAFLATGGVAPRVTVGAWTAALGSLKALSFRAGNDYWVGFANRLVLPGRDFQKVPPPRLHQVLDELPVTVTLDPDATPRYAVSMPLGAREGDSYRAQPRMLTLAGNRFVLPRLVDCAAVLLTAAHDPVVGIEASPVKATAGQEVQVVVQAANPSPQAAPLKLQVDGGPGLTPGPPVSLDCPAGGTAQARLSATVAAGAAAGFSALQVVATMPDGTRLLSPSAEIEILPDVELRFVGADQTLFLTPDSPATVTVQALSNRPQPGSVAIAVEAPAGYSVELPRPTTPLGHGEWVSLTATLKGQADAPRLGAATLTVTVQCGGATRRETRSLRLARGAVAFTEDRRMRPSNASDAREGLVLACLENPYLRAEWITGSATLHSLIPRHTGRDVLLEGDYPIGLVWYALPGGWTSRQLTCDGNAATLVLQGGPQGKITMTATLGTDDRQVRITYDCADLGPQKAEFYLMSRVDPGGGKRDVTIVPTKAGLLKLERGKREIPAADLTAHWVAVAGPAAGDVLGVAYSLPVLDHLTVMPRQAPANYVLFSPADRAPGKLTFWLTAGKGDDTTVARWYQSLGSP